MSNPVEKYFQETGQTTLIIKIDKFLNKDDIEDLQITCREMIGKTYYDEDREHYDNLIQKLEYIKGLLK
jgi:hypothetical protein